MNRNSNYSYLCNIFFRKMAENRGYMQRYAMLFGTYMGGYWILKFILFPLGLMVPFLLFLFAGLTVCVPFMGYYYTRMYRNHVCGGNIGFLQAWIFTVFMYIFAALLTAVAHYICNQYLRNHVGQFLARQHSGRGNLCKPTKGCFGCDANPYSHRHHHATYVAKCILWFLTGHSHRIICNEKETRGQQ